MTQEAQTTTDHFLMSGDEVADAFIHLAAHTDQQTIRALFSSTAMLLLSNERVSSEEPTPTEVRTALENAANGAFDLLVAELEQIRDTKLEVAKNAEAFLG